MPDRKTGALRCIAEARLKPGLQLTVTELLDEVGRTLTVAHGRTVPSTLLSEYSNGHRRAERDKHGSSHVISSQFMRGRISTPGRHAREAFHIRPPGTIEREAPGRLARMTSNQARLSA